MSSLVERLRATEVVGWQPSADGLGVAVKTPVNPDGPEAANEIERLERALENKTAQLESLREAVRDAGFKTEWVVRNPEALSLHKGGRDGD